MKRLVLSLSLILLTLGFEAPTIAQAGEVARSTVDRPDDFKGYQIHVVYVVPKGSSDLKYDTNGFLNRMTVDAQRWLKEKAGNQFKIDTYQDQLDVTFLQSKYSAAELCADKCEALALLAGELREQDPTFDGSKTIYFDFSESLDEGSCGWAPNFSALALGHSSAGGCNRDSALSRTGLTGVAKTFIHEIFHTYGVNHVCGDNSELMIGTPQCTIDYDQYGYLKTTLDSTKSNYFGGNKAGVNVLKLPIWQIETGDISESILESTSETKSLPTLKSGQVFARSGFKTDAFSWKWNRSLSAELLKNECVMVSELGKIVGVAVRKECYFDVPNTWDIGMDFTVRQDISVGPFKGFATATGKIAREDYSINPCTEETCFVGGTTSVDICWNTNRNNVILQKLVKGRWQNYSTIKVVVDRAECTDSKYPKHTKANVVISESGNNYFRWYAPENANTAEFKDEPFAIIGHLQHLPEPSASEIEEANLLAVKVGAEADRLGALPAKTIKCVNLKKVIKTVTGVKPQCPPGYAVKR